MKKIVFLMMLVSAVFANDIGCKTLTQIKAIDEAIDKKALVIRLYWAGQCDEINPIKVTKYKRRYAEVLADNGLMYWIKR